MSDYSQFEDAPIIDRLLRESGVSDPGTCCEFGALDGLINSNTAHLVRHRGWHGIFMEWKHMPELRDNYERFGAEVYNVEVTPDNVNDYIPENVDLVSIDIDGNDYWVWKALKARPSVVVIECNHHTRDENHLHPYVESYRRALDPEGRTAYGASPARLIELGEEKGYDFADRDKIGSKPGPNLFFRKRL